MHILAFPSSVFNAIFQNARINRWMETFIFSESTGQKSRYLFKITNLSTVKNMLCSMNVILLYYIPHVVAVIMWPIGLQRQFAFLSFINPLQWPHGIVKCPSEAHFRIFREVVGHLDNFSIYFSLCIRQIRTYCSVHVQLLAYCIAGKLPYSDTAYSIPVTRIWLKTHWLSFTILYSFTFSHFVYSFFKTLYE